MLNLQSRVSPMQTRWGVLFPAGVTSHTAGMAGGPHYTHILSLSSPRITLTTPPQHCWIPVAPSLQSGTSRSTFLAAVMENKKNLIQGLSCPAFLPQKQFFHPVWKLRSYVLTLKNEDFIESLLSPTPLTPSELFYAFVRQMRRGDVKPWEEGDHLRLIRNQLPVPHIVPSWPNTDSGRAIHGTQFLIYKMFNN